MSAAEKDYAPDILARAEGLVVVNKRAGLAVHGGARIRWSLVDDLSRSLGCPVFPVHRLDQDTSGVILMGLSSKHAHTWGERLAQGRKRYHAIALGRFKKTRFTVDVPVGSHGGDRGAPPQPAVTHFAVLKSLGPFTLVEATLETGRMHQIRLHLAHVERPVLGDDKYGTFDTNKEWARRLGRNHLFLHAAEIELEGLKVRAPWPEHFIQLLKIYNCDFPPWSRGRTRRERKPKTQDKEGTADA